MIIIKYPEETPSEELQELINILHKKDERIIVIPSAIEVILDAPLDELIKMRYMVDGILNERLGK